MAPFFETLLLVGRGLFLLVAGDLVLTFWQNYGYEYWFGWMDTVAMLMQNMTSVLFHWCQAYLPGGIYLPKIVMLFVLYFIMKVLRKSLETFR